MSNVDTFLQAIHNNSHLFQRLQNAQSAVLQTIAQELGFTLSADELDLVQSHLNEEISENLLATVSGGRGKEEQDDSIHPPDLGDSGSKGPGIKG